MDRALVPPAAINEDGQPVAGQQDVGGASPAEGPMQSEPETQSVQG
jgi:hypothetical protein